MKAAAVLALVAAATVVSAETNAQRLARGLPPNAPAKRATPVDAARRATPSGSRGGGGGQCNTGSISCCESYGSQSQDASVTELLNLLGLPDDYSVGSNCSGVSSVTDCSQQPVCCENNQFNGVITIGCSPITINA